MKFTQLLRGQLRYSRGKKATMLPKEVARKKMMKGLSLTPIRMFLEKLINDDNGVKFDTNMFVLEEFDLLFERWRK